jgi:hypothetical protein
MFTSQLHTYASSCPHLAIVPTWNQTCPNEWRLSGVLMYYYALEVMGITTVLRYRPHPRTSCANILPCFPARLCKLYCCHNAKLADHIGTKTDDIAKYPNKMYSYLLNKMMVDSLEGCNGDLKWQPPWWLVRSCECVRFLHLLAAKTHIFVHFWQ